MESTGCSVEVNSSTGVAHTPGPWTYYSGSRGIYGSDGAGGEKSICTLHGPRRDRAKPERDANARLIAAAPDLLDALQGLLDAVRRSTCDGSGPAQDVAVQALRKALPPPPADAL